MGGNTSLALDGDSYLYMDDAATGIHVFNISGVSTPEPSAAGTFMLGIAALWMMQAATSAARSIEHFRCQPACGQCHFNQAREPWGERGYCASFNGTLQDECLNGASFYSLKSTFYNTIRHSSPRYRPPEPVTWIAPA
jgi:hypothetical protein